MMTRSVEFEMVKHGSPEYFQAIKLREKILRHSINSFFSDEEISKEKNHIHVTGHVDKQLVATCALVIELENKQAKMQRVAVQQNFQNQGIGSAMVEYCENLAKSKNLKEIYVSARAAEGLSAVSFYSKHQYKKEGNLFEEDGIPHQIMRKKL